MFGKTIAAVVVAVGAGLITAGPVLAGPVDLSITKLPAPGILGLVAIGVIGAIALARSRK